jgi:hypothetical protein
MTPAPAFAILIGANQLRSEIMLGARMDETNQLLLTALTLILAKQIRAESAAAGVEMTADPVNEAVQLIQQHRMPATGRFGVAHF